jgi:hypothetical protein
MTNATRAGINLGQSLARSPTVSRSMSGGLRYLRDSTIADAVTAPAYTITARVLYWVTAFRILCMIPLAVPKSIRLAGALLGKTATAGASGMRPLNQYFTVRRRESVRRP